MAITEPLNLLDGFPGWSTSFELMARQEQSRHASGRTRVKDFGSPIWMGTWVSKPLSPNLLDEWHARLSAAAIDQMTFWGRPLSRCRPIKHPGQSALPVGSLQTIGSNNKSARVSGLLGISLSIGDMVQVGNNLHRVLEPAAAVAGLTPMFEVRPHFWPGTATGQPVLISKPSCLMVIVPGSVSAAGDARTGRGPVSFQAMEARG